MKYIVLAGAPGSKWSSVSEDIRNFAEVNTSDRATGSYIKPGEDRPMHTGAYWDPGMDYGKKFDVLPSFSTEVLEWEFDLPFQEVDNRPRVIKSHQFSKFLPNIVQRSEWIYNPVVMVQRSAYECEQWWYEAGGFDITYPGYTWYENTTKMRQEIEAQVNGINSFIANHPTKQVGSVGELAHTLGLTMEEERDREFKDMQVYVYLHPRLRYFKDTWRGNLPQYKFSGDTTLDRIGPDETVLDIGCGSNYFKPMLGDRITGIDPINPAADHRVSIDEYMLREQFDHVLAYGSLNFGTRLDIERQVRKAVQCTKPGGKLHWRLNPGRYDHNRPGQECLELFDWNEQAVHQMAARNGCVVDQLEWDVNNRYFSLWSKK